MSGDVLFELRLDAANASGDVVADDAAHGWVLHSAGG